MPCTAGSPAAGYNCGMDERARPRWYQFSLRHLFLSTFFAAVGCAAFVKSLPTWPSQKIRLMWIFLSTFALLAAGLSLKGRYKAIFALMAFASIFFLILFLFFKQPLLI